MTCARRLMTLLLALSFLGAANLHAAVGSRPGAGTASWSFWDRYAAHFIRPEGRVADPDRGSMTTSEGQSYAMFFALVANDPVMFEHLRQWTEVNLARGSLGTNLPSWSWGRTNEGSWGVLDVNSASDSDLWIAYDLLQAGVLWNKPEYQGQALSLLDHIARVEVADVPGLGPVLMPGREGFHPSEDSWVLNPSYMPLPLFQAAAHEAPAGPWKAMAKGLPALLAQTGSGGFAMDWVRYTRGQGFTPAPGPGEDPKPAQGSYDAIRVYLWLGIGSHDGPAHERLLAAFAPIGRYLRMHPLPPEAVDPGGKVSGNGPVGFSAALTPFLWSMNERFTADEQQRRVQSAFDPQTGLLGSPARYYDQNLALFAMGWLEKRFRFGADGMLRVPWKN